MGSTDATKEDQLAVAYISILSNSAVSNELKINFVQGEMEIITEAVN